MGRRQWFCIPEISTDKQIREIGRKSHLCSLLMSWSTAIRKESLRPLWLEQEALWVSILWEIYFPKRNLCNLLSRVFQRPTHHASKRTPQGTGWKHLLHRVQIPRSQVKTSLSSVSICSRNTPKTGWASETKTFPGAFGPGWKNRKGTPHKS